jgi:pseudouridine kinase
MDNLEIKVVAIGAANIDVQGFPERPLTMRDSNPGQVRTCPGGVARNIAENLARLGIPVALITALGDDPEGERIRESCRGPGISLEYSMTVKGHASSSYIAILDENGDLALALSDMSILEHLGEDHLRSCLPLLSQASVIVADACLTAGALRWLANELQGAKIYIDPVSTGKCPRMEEIAGRFYCIKMNRIEAAYLAGMPIENDSDLKEASRRLLIRGVKRLYITLGAEGVFFADEKHAGKVPAFPVRPVSATGAGDAFTAAAVYGDLLGWSMEETTRFAVRASSLTLLSRRTVSERMSVAAAEALQ